MRTLTRSVASHSWNMLPHRLCRFTLVLMLAACATPPIAALPFAELRGCWRSAEFGSLDWQPTADDRWIGRLRRESGWCSASDQNGLNGCAFVLERQGETWRFEDQRTDNIQTYRLLASDERGATFAAEGHPLRPPPNFGLEVQVERDRISIANTAADPVVLFEGSRC